MQGLWGSQVIVLLYWSIVFNETCMKENIINLVMIYKVCSNKIINIIIIYCVLLKYCISPIDDIIDN